MNFNVIIKQKEVMFMLNKLIIALSSIAVGFICISGIDVHNKAVSAEDNENPDYVSLFTKESESILEQAYINENDMFFAETLPYYKKEPEKETITVTINTHNNSIIHELKN